MRIPEDDEVDGNIDINERPPCRQNTNVFDLEEKFSSVKNIQNVYKERLSRDKIRPPSRHKTPPKALGLDLLPKRNFIEAHPADFVKDSPLSDVENTSFSNTMPLNFTDSDKKKTISIFAKETDPFEVKNLFKPKSAQGKNIDKANSRT